ncbi:MAG TPA: DUF4129 domain-containing protein [Solirubrobacter sp.]|nr:DUF4129 domain-containing protein [Solirubrobacter sp.]
MSPRVGAERRSVLAVAVVALLALVAAASGDGGAHVTVPEGVGRAVAGLALGLIGALLVLGLAIVVIALPRPQRRPRDSWRRWVPAQRGGGPVLLAAIVVLALIFVVTLRAIDRHPQRSPVVPAAPAPQFRPTPGGTGSQAPTLWLLGGALVGVGVLGVVAYREAAKRDDRALRPVLDETDDDAARAAIEPPGAVDERDAGWPADPRAAVLVAYARGERELAAAGLPRDRAEGPREYAVRARRAPAVDPGAVTTLTALYERARYSPHPISPAMAATAARASTTVAPGESAAGGGETAHGGGETAHGGGETTHGGGETTHSGSETTHSGSDDPAAGEATPC